jgi:hypothetical protein
MTKLIIAACCVFMSNAASAAEITASYMYAICVQGDPSCGTYLRGVYDGVRTGKDIICPRGDIEDVQLRERFIASMAAAQRLKNYDVDKPAATMALASFKFFMPCK